MDRPFKVQWIDLSEPTSSLEDALNEHHKQFPVWYLVSVVLHSKNPDVYQAVWALAA